LNKNINVYNTTKQQDASNQTKNTYANTRRHSQAHAANYAQSDARHLNGNDERHSYGIDARNDNMNRTQENTPSTQQEEEVHKTLHYKYEELNLKLENPDLTDARIVTNARIVSDKVHTQINKSVVFQYTLGEKAQPEHEDGGRLISIEQVHHSRGTLCTYLQLPTR